MPDPVANAIRDLLKRIAEQDQRIAELGAALARSGGGEVPAPPAPLAVPEFCKDSGR